MQVVNLHYDLTGIMKGADVWLSLAEVQELYARKVSASGTPSGRRVNRHLQLMHEYGICDRRLVKRDGRLVLEFRYLGDLPGIR